MFYDLNQLGANFGAGDSKRYEYRLAMWGQSLAKIPHCTEISLSINYRNSREIAEYYSNVLGEVLPERINSEIPVFSTGEVIERKTSEKQSLPALIADLVFKLKKEFAVTRFIAHEQERGLTGRNFVGHISTLFGWLTSEQRFNKPNPVIPRIHSQRGAPTSARPYSDNDVAAIWEAVENTSNMQLMTPLLMFAL